MDEYYNLQWEDLEEYEKALAKEQYICIRECEEERARDDVTSNPDYDYLITGEGVEYCTFHRIIDEDGELNNIEVCVY